MIRGLINEAKLKVKIGNYITTNYDNGLWKVLDIIYDKREINKLNPTGIEYYCISFNKNEYMRIPHYQVKDILFKHLK